MNPNMATLHWRDSLRTRFISVVIKESSQNAIILLLWVLERILLLWNIFCFLLTLYKLLCQTAEVCKKPVWGMIIRYRSQLCSVLASSQATDLKKSNFIDWLMQFWFPRAQETNSITHCSGADWGITPASHFTITPKGCSRRWFKKTNCRTEQS